jgi:hypothetical protein
MILVASGTVAAPNIKLYLVAAGAFVDLGATVNVAQWADGRHKLVLTETARDLVVWLGTPGTGETYDVEIVSNGADWTGGPPPTGWTAGGGNCTLAAVAGGQAGNCLQLTRTGAAYQYFYQEKAGPTSGALYVLNGYVKSGTSGNEESWLVFKDGAYNSTNTRVVILTTSGAWVAYSPAYITTSQAVKISFVFQKNTATAGTMLWDTISSKKVLSPSSSGCTALNGPESATQSIVSETTGFDRNAASYSYAVYGLPVPFISIPGSVRYRKMFHDGSSFYV